jgi:hypothetical protein
MVDAVFSDVATTQELCLASKIPADWQPLQMFHFCHVYPPLKVYGIFF